MSPKITKSIQFIKNQWLTIVVIGLASYQITGYIQDLCWRYFSN